MPSLDGAVTLVEMHHVAIAVSQYLYLYVFRSLQIFFNEDIVDAEGLFSFALSAPELIRHLLFAPDYPHTSAAASGCRLQHYRVAAFLGKPESHFFRWDGLSDARDSRRAHFVGNDLGLHLISQSVHHRMVRSYKDDSFFFTRFRKFDVLSQESISRMDGVYTLGLGKFDYLVYCQISVHR